MPMTPKNKPLLDIATPFVDSHEDPQGLLDIAIEYTKGMLKDENEMTPALHWSLCTSLAEYLHYVEDYPLYKIRAGYLVTKKGERFPHIWLELPDGRILDPIAGMRDENFPPDVYSIVYLGKKLEWYKTEK